MVAALLVLMVLAIYQPVTRFEFINCDDPAYINTNLHVVRGLTWEGLGWAFTHSCVGNWHPVTFITHMLDCQLYGPDAGGHHLTSLIFHAADSVLLFLLLRSLTGAFWRSSVVAGLFAVHPAHVESVAWIAERKDVLSAFFGLLCLWAYAAYTRAGSNKPAGVPGEGTSRPLFLSRGGLRIPGEQNEGTSRPLPFRLAGFVQSGSFYYGLTLVLLALALMSKAMLVTWPGVMLLLDFWPLDRFGSREAGSVPFSPPWWRRLGRLIWEKVPFFALSGIVSVITVLVVKAAGGMATTQQLPLGLRLAGVPVNYARYLWELIWPVKLAAVYPYVRQWPLPVALGCAVLLAGITVLSIWQHRQRPYLLTGWFWFLGTLVPVIGLVQAGSQSIADRFTYLPSIGFFLVLAWGGAELVKATRAPAVIGGLAAGAALAVCTLLAQAQVLYWQNSETVFRHAAQVTTGNFIAYRSLGLYYAGYGEHQDAIRAYRAALAIQPGDRYSWNGLAMALINQRKYDEAAQACQAVLQEDPGMALAQSTLGLALSKLGQTNEALTHYNLALSLDPNLADTHYNLANTLAAEGQLKAAREHYAQAARLNPGSADAHNNLAYMLLRTGQWDQANTEFRSALVLEPELWQARYGLAQALVHGGDTAEAVNQYRLLLQSKPGVVDALNRLAWILATDPDPEVRRGIEAVALAEQACQLTRNQQPALLSTLAAAYAEVGRFADAVRAAELAVQLSSAAGRADAARRSQALLELFRSGRPYHEPAKQASRG